MGIVEKTEIKSKAWRTLNTCEQLHWLYEQYGEAVRLVPWWEFWANYRWLWICKEKEGCYVANVASGKKSHSRACGICPGVTFDPSGKGVKAFKTLAITWMVNDEGDRAAVIDLVQRYVQQAYDLARRSA